MNFYQVFVASLLIATCSSAKVEFFQNPNYSGLISSGSPSDDLTKCNTFDAFVSRQTSSVKVYEDACVILFDENGCSGKSIKIDQNVADISALVGDGTNDNFDKKAVSYKFCGGQDEATDNIRVDFFDVANYENKSANYDNICKCISLPSSILINVTSVDNHHNCIELFSNNNCAENGESVKLFAGKSSLSADISDTVVFGNIQSLIPCSIPAKCTKLEATLYAFEIEDADTETILQQSSRNAMSMAAKTVVWNNGTATVSQEYDATKSVREVVEVETIDTHKTVQSWSTTQTTSKTTKTGFLGLGKTVTETLTDTYSRTDEHTSTKREKHTTDVMTQFTARQLIEVPPCSFYEVESFVTVIENFPMVYKAIFKFTGTTAGEPMTTAELKRAVEGQNEFTYMEDIDEFSISAYANSTITASFGVETEIKGNGGRVPFCVTKAEL